MDHLPPVSQPHNPVHVGYLGGQYDGLGFSSFPDRQGINVQQLQRNDFSQISKEGAAKFLQAWFFFGMIHEFLDVPIDMADFIRLEGDQQLITTSRIQEYLGRWKVVNDAAKGDPTGVELQNRNNRVIQCIATSHGIWRAFSDFTGIVGPEIELSIQIMGSTLEFAMSLVSGIRSTQLAWGRDRNDFLTQRMLDDGWCPSLIEQIFNPCRLVWQYFVSLFGPPKDGHGPEVGCNQFDICCRLKTMPVKDEDYHSQHVCKDGDCGNIKTDSSTLDAIVGRGGIPLLEYDQATSELKVIEFEKGMQYTAISHVWTDGLGNPEENSMPKCQIESMVLSMSKLPWTNKCLLPLGDQDLVWSTEFTTVELSPDKEENKKRPLLFWIDTICVPREINLRHAAVDNMRAVYNRSNRVLVFDAGLRDIKGPLSAEEIWTRVSLSNWIRRFWTLQEAILAKMIWYQFGDDCYRQISDPTPIFERTFDNQVAYYCEDFDFSWRQLAPHWDYLQRVRSVWSALRYRTSSFKEDQPICIAILLDMKVDQLQQLSENERFQRLWTMYEAIPSSILFTVCPKLDIEGLHWAPDALTSLGTLGAPNLSPAIPMREGLLVTHHALVVTEPLTENRHGVIAMTLGEETYLICQNLKQNNTPWQGLDFTTTGRIAVLIGQRSLSVGEDPPPFEAALGALVAIQHQDDGRIVANYLRAVSILLKGSRWEHGRPWEDWQETEKTMTVPAEYSALQQKWLIK